MGVSYYTCAECGANYPDYWDEKSYCDGCDADFCSDDCHEVGGRKAAIDHWDEEKKEFIRIELSPEQLEEFESYGEIRDEDGDEIETCWIGCKFCTKKEAHDSELVEHLLLKFNLTREEAIADFYKEQS